MHRRTQTYPDDSSYMGRTVLWGDPLWGTIEIKKTLVFLHSENFAAFTGIPVVGFLF